MALTPEQLSGVGLPLRLTTSEVCQLARYRPNTLARRIAAGAMPKPVDRAQQHLYDRDPVLEALGLAIREVMPQDQGNLDWRVATERFKKFEDARPIKKNGHKLPLTRLQREELWVKVFGASVKNPYSPAKG